LKTVHKHKIEVKRTWHGVGEEEAEDGWTLAWKRPVQLLAAVAKTRMAIRFWQRIWQMVVGLPL
jgi:hypothetical protein